MPNPLLVHIAYCAPKVNHSQLLSDIWEIHCCTPLSDNKMLHIPQHDVSHEHKGWKLISTMAVHTTTKWRATPCERVTVSLQSILPDYYEEDNL
jgi:hypothetical protein